MKRKISIYQFCKARKACEFGLAYVKGKRASEALWSGAAQGNQAWLATELRVDLKKFGACGEVHPECAYDAGKGCTCKALRERDAPKAWAAVRKALIKRGVAVL